MSDAGAPRRRAVERGIYVRPDGHTFEVGYRDSAGKQRWCTVSGDLVEARRLRENLARWRNTRRLRADLLEVDRMAENATPVRRDLVRYLRATSGQHQRAAWLRVAALALAMARRLERPPEPSR